MPNPSMRPAWACVAFLVLACTAGSAIAQDAAGSPLPRGRPVDQDAAGPPLPRGRLFTPDEPSLRPIPASWVAADEVVQPREAQEVKAELARQERVAADIERNKSYSIPPAEII